MECNDCTNKGIITTDLEDVNYCRDCYGTYCQDKIDELENEIEDWKRKSDKNEGEQR